MIFSLVSYVSINCIRFTGIISAQSTPTNNGVQSIYFVGEGQGDCNISTHSRPKAATRRAVHGATRGNVSTHSRAEAAADFVAGFNFVNHRFNTQPRGGGCLGTNYQDERRCGVSTHSRAEAAAKYSPWFGLRRCVSTHSRAEAAAYDSWYIVLTRTWFQHTAARRRLHWRILKISSKTLVSTHSRAEAAADYLQDVVNDWAVSTHSRAEAAAPIRPNIGLIFD